MRLQNLLATGLVLLLPSLGFAADAAPTTAHFSDADRAEVESIIREFLVKKHPEVLKEAIDELQRREQSAAETKTEKSIDDHKDQIYHDAGTPVGGNAKGDVTVVEFFDFQCGYCKMAEEGIEKLLKEDKNVKFIYKDFPILGPVSTVASKAALASIRQNKYIPFHDAMMTKKEHLTEDMIYDIAHQVGLNVDKLKKDMADEAITKQLDANVKLGTDIGVRGTPMFIIGGQVFPGAIQYDALKKAVTEERGKK